MITLRVPTKEPYAYMEVQLDSPDTTEAFRIYKDLTGMVQKDSSLLEKEFNRVLDQYIWGTGTMTSEEYDAMSPGQQAIIQTIKRSRARNKTPV
jgi:hypothetical protein